MNTEILPWWSRIWLAFHLFFRVLFDGRYAAAARALGAGPPGELGEGAAAAAPGHAPAVPVTHAPDSALLLLGMLQTEGRFVDFVQQDVVPFSDAEVGAVARVVHAGCRKVLASHLQIEPIRSEPEGQSITLEPGFDPSRVKLTGNVGGRGPLHGVLRHRGWQATDVHLPMLVDGASSRVLCPAEVEM